MGLKKDLTLQIGALNPDITEVIGNSAIELLKEQFDTSATCEGPENVENFNSTSQVSGVVTLFQQECQGVFLVGFNKACIFHLLEKLYDKKFSSIDEVVQGGVAEITNIIFGRFKQKLNELGYDFKMVIPSVIIGTEHSFNLCSSSSSVHKLKINLENDNHIEIFIALTSNN